ncbi:hypothetical protein [Aquabacterium sp. OR-4]|uniref:hypothetical protein n=1 Tax=Aquabacterium sp. OR-4 TaxID=2978127 RepID=UPI0021B30B79|nr:hypothetical protein [Aquabacterium sp. OR-4]MDT7837970.1 hypothetical protein [Aquabacterium sp. OR-4]
MTERQRRAQVARRLLDDAPDEARTLSWAQLGQAPAWLALDEPELRQLALRCGSVLAAPVLRLWIAGPLRQLARCALGAPWWRALRTAPAWPALPKAPGGPAGGGPHDSAHDSAHVTPHVSPHNAMPDGLPDGLPNGLPDGLLASLLDGHTDSATSPLAAHAAHADGLSLHGADPAPERSARLRRELGEAGATVLLASLPHGALRHAASRRLGSVAAWVMPQPTALAVLDATLALQRQLALQTTTAPTPAQAAA